jgi:hypothetical protein
MSVYPVPCPTCEQPPDVPCRSEDGLTHTARVQAILTEIHRRVDNSLYPLLVPGVQVFHPSYGTGRILDASWEYGQPLVQYGDETIAFSRPEKLSVQGQTPEEYPDLVPGALVSHPKYGTGRIVDTPWQYGQPVVQYDDGLRGASNPDRLSTNDDA